MSSGTELTKPWFGSFAGLVSLGVHARAAAAALNAMTVVTAASIL